MMSMTTVLMTLHVAAGVVALATFLIPIAVHKGGRIHRRAGWAFVGAMAVICLTALPVSAIRAQAAETPGAALFSQGGFFITLVSGSAVWKGMRVLRAKGVGRHIHTLDLGACVGMFVAGVWATATGARAHNLILLFFGPFTALGAVADLRYWLNPNKPKMHWFFAHMSAMMGATVAALTAFMFFGARSLGSGTPRTWAFVGPTIVLMPILAAMRAHYRRRFEGPAESPTAADADKPVRNLGVGGAVPAVSAIGSRRSGDWS